MKKWLVFVCFCGAAICCNAQAPYSDDYKKDSVDTKSIKFSLLKDTTEWDRPKKATFLAVAIPGAGQIYNRKYWKAGLVYSGIGGLIYSLNLSKDSLARYQSILVSKIDGDTGTIDYYPQLTTAGVTSSRDFYRRNRDVTIIGFVALYAFQIIDANVDAHLKEFDLNDDLALHISPDIMRRRAGIGTYTGLTLTLRIK
ncbi:DUF5683 domain-containing protein [Bacteroidia bacterium]|nr:DUF5683 domain-containing protein [Bacteroidia bacterium]